MRILLISLFFFVIVIPCFSQNYLQEDLTKLKKLTHQRTKEQSYTIEKDMHGFFEVVAGGLFVLYKNFVSSQDAGNCSFSPSCSVYMKNALEEMGVVKGLLDGIDRVMRCNGAHTDQYFIDHEKRKLIDPVSL